MKRLTAIITLVLCCALPACAADDSVDAFKRIFKGFPDTVGTLITRYKVSDTNFDVKKTDSLVTPIVGIIEFTVLFTYTEPAFRKKYRMEFTWSDNHWKFARILNSKGVDETADTRELAESGRTLISDGPMKSFLNGDNFNQKR